MANDPVIKKGKVYQRFNLSEMFPGVDFSARPELKAIVGQAIIDHIVSRTQDGKAIGGTRELKRPYSKEYVESVEFKAAGKSKNEVNMTLNGDMLGLLTQTDETANTITIGWEDEKENLKAYNHNVGDTVPKRDFFGLNRTEQRAIAQRLKPEIAQANEDISENGRSDLVDRALKFLDAIDASSEADDGE